MNISPRSNSKFQAKYGNVNTAYMADMLRYLLSIEYVLYVKIQNFHWNVTGMSFVGIHELLGKHYAQVAEFIDQLAEQIRKYGKPSPGSLQEFLTINNQVGGLEENPGILINERDVVSIMITSNEKLIQSINSLDNSQIDLATQNLLGSILDFHMKAVWMWTSHLS
jgi:starvation-inducible DNA-binding protein